MPARRPLLHSLMLVLATSVIPLQCADTEKTPMKVNEYEDRIEMATENYTLAVYKPTFQVAIIRDGRFLLSTPGDMQPPVAPRGGQCTRSGLGFQALTGGKERCFLRVQDFSAQGDELTLTLSADTEDATASYRLRLLPERIEARAEVRGLDDVDRVTQAFLLAPSRHWYGGAVDQAHQWPLETHEWNADPFLATSNQASPFWMASSGIGIFLNTYDDIAASLNKGHDGLLRIAYLHSPALHYMIFVGKNIAEARDLFAATVGKPRKRPPDDVFERPVWSTWCQYFAKVSQRDVLAYARHIHDGHWPASIIEVDDGWQTHYGDNVFNAKFPNPKSLAEEVHKLGYRLTLWVENFANLDSDRYREGEQNGGLIRDAASGKPARVHWWNGEAALIDLGDDQVRAGYVDKLRTLMRRYGIDGFKFDGGDAEYWPAAGALSAPGPLTRNRYTDLWAEVGGEFELNELRVGWLSQPLGLFNRLRDKRASWSEADGLPAIIPHGGIQSLLGFVFNCPDLIGGGLDEGFRPDEELNIRWTEAAAFMPIMQFSYGPWQFSEPAQKIMRRFALMHGKLWHSHLKALVERAMTTGKPIWSPLFYVFPEVDATYLIHDEFIVGDSLLVAPVVEAGARQRDVYLPPGRWRDFWSDNVLEGGRTLRGYPAPLETIPAFERLNPRARGNMK